MKRYRKASFVSFLIVIVLFLNGCGFFNGPYKKRMLEYYSDDINYTTLSGTIISKDNNNAIIEVDISIYNGVFPVNTNSCQFFRLYTNTYIIQNIEKGDFITFISAPEYFYDGQYLPILAIEKEGTIYLSFEEGKKNYLEWIQLNFS